MNNGKKKKLNGLVEPTEQIKSLKNIIGPKALRCLTQNNGVLKIWRNSSPHNWWVEGSRGAMHWHSSDREPRLNLSDAKVIQYWGSDSGHPQLSVYRLKVNFK